MGAILAHLVHVSKYHPDETYITDTSDRNGGDYGHLPVINPNFETNPCEALVNGLHRIDGYRAEIKFTERRV